MIRKKSLFLIFILLAGLVFLSGCNGDSSGSGTETGNSLSSALDTLKDADVSFSDAETPADFDSYLAKIAELKQTQSQNLNENEKNAFVFFADYKIKSIETKKHAYKIANGVTPERIRSADEEQLINVSEDIDTLITEIDDALNTLSEFESVYADYSQNANTTKEQEQLSELKTNFLNLQTEVENAVDEIPKFKIPEGITGEITFEEAKQIIIDNLISESADPKPLIFSNEEMLTSGTEVNQYGKDKFDNLIWKTTDDVWFFWIDDFPDAEFAHPTRFAFVKNTGEYIVFDADFWPVISDNSVFDSDDLIYGTFSSTISYETNALAFSPSEDAFYFQEEPEAAAPAGFPAAGTPCPCNRPSKTYGLIIQASPGVEPSGKKMSFQTNADMINDLVKGTGVTPADVEYLADSQNTGADVDGTATMENIKTSIANIKAKIKCCDLLFVYLTTHGGLQCKVTWTNIITGGESTETLYNSKCPEPGDTSWAIWMVTSVTYKNWFSIPGAGADKDPWASQFADLFDEIDNCNSYFIFQSCHSGGVIPELKGKGRTIITSADTTHSSYAGGPGKPSPVTGAFVNGMNGAAGADADGDGEVSLEEGMNFGKKNFTGGNSYPQYWDSKAPCECPPEDCGEADDTGDGITGTVIIGGTLLVDGVVSTHIDINPEVNNHIIIESNDAFVLPFTITVTGDIYANDYVISDSDTQCASSTMCSTDIDTTGMITGNAIITASIDSSFSKTFEVINSSCTEDWTCNEYGSWSTCSSGTQMRTRTCADNNDCGTTANKPDEEESQSCETECTESWSCGDWGSWSLWGVCQESNTQSRSRTKTCTDANSCGTTENKPATSESESQSCEYIPTEQKAEYTAHENSLGSNITNLDYIGDSAEFDLSLTSGTYGYRVLTIPAGQTIEACVTVTGGTDPLYFYFYPQYHYGFDFTDTDPGCTEVYNKNSWANGVLIHLGDPNPANVQGLITIIPV